MKLKRCSLVALVATVLLASLPATSFAAPSAGACERYRQHEYYVYAGVMKKLSQADRNGLAECNAAERKIQATNEDRHNKRKNSFGEKVVSGLFPF